MKAAIKGVLVIAVGTLGAWAIVHWLTSAEGVQVTDSPAKAEIVSKHPPSKHASATASPRAQVEPARPIAPPRDQALAALVDRRATPRITPDITSRIPRVSRKEIPSVVSVLLDTEDHDAVRNEAANLLRRSGHEGLTDDLVRVLHNPGEGPRFRSFCIQQLWQNSRKAGPEELKKIRTVLRKALQDEEVKVRREALLALVRMHDPKGKEAAVKWLTDDEAEGVRDAAIRCVRELDLREHIPAVRSYARDPDVTVRIAAIVTLSQWGDEESRPAFEEAANSEVVRLQRAGKAALKRLNAVGKRQEQPSPQR